MIAAVEMPSFFAAVVTGFELVEPPVLLAPLLVCVDVCVAPIVVRIVVTAPPCKVLVTALVVAGDPPVFPVVAAVPPA